MAPCCLLLLALEIKGFLITLQSDYTFCIHKCLHSQRRATADIVTALLLLVASKAVFDRLKAIWRETATALRLRLFLNELRIHDTDLQDLRLILLHWKLEDLGWRGKNIDMIIIDRAHWVLTVISIIRFLISEEVVLPSFLMVYFLLGMNRFLSVVLAFETWWLLRSLFPKSGYRFNVLRMQFPFT